MSFATEQGRAFAAARMGVKTLEMKAGGWDVGQAHEERLIQPAIFFYVMDQKTQWMWMCSVPKSSFYEGVKRLPPYTADLAVAGVAAVVNQAAQGKAEGEWEEQLAKLLSAYIVNTRTYEQSGQGRLASHFMFMHYGKASMIRPAALGGSDQHVIPAHIILSRFHDLIAHDRQRNPLWVAD